MPLSIWRLDPAASPRRFLELDGLRGLAALAVVGYHLKREWFPYGWAAVDLFFVLSGFLITSIILRDGHHPGFLRRFYLRRGLRIWPIYYLTILALILANALRLLPVRCHWAGLWPYLTYTQNLPDYWGGRSPVLHPWLRHTWTLAIEEQFYLLWPALVLLAGRRRVVPLALACLVATVAARLGGIKMTLLLGRLDGLALGALLAALTVRDSSPLPQGGGPGRGGDAPDSSATFTKYPRLQSAIRDPQSAILASALLLAALALTNRLGPYQPEPGATLTILAANLSAFGLVAWTVRHAGRRRAAFLRAPGLVLLGQMSYGLYLYHPLVLGYSAGALRLARWGDMPPMRLMLTLAACLAVATLSWFLIEKPLLRLKDRLAREPAPPIPPPHAEVGTPASAESLAPANRR
jgi:peptidoglycan/LPS O-acetylase OafA/YrhL